MKNLMIIVLFILNSNVYGQNNTIEAFKNSYAYESQENYTKAISAFENLNKSDSYSIILRLGWLHYMNADYMKSKTYYEKAIQIKSKSIEAKLGLIYPLAAVNNWDDVMVVYQSILSIDNNHTSSHYQLAYIYFVRKKYTDAEKHLKTVLSLYPFDYDSNALIGNVYVKLGQIKEAKYHYNKALEYNPSATEIESILKGL
jgi:tetratricopeptide (TPR) repeat protein